MSPNPRRDASFVIRIWWERWAENQLHWRGQVVHASNRQSAYFEALPALIKFLEQWAGNLSTQNENTIQVALEKSLQEDDRDQMGKSPFDKQSTITNSEKKERN